MHETDAQRLQNDLQTLREVVGAELPFERIDAIGTVITGAAALFPGVLCLAGMREPRWLLMACIPFIASLGIFLSRNYLAAHPSKPCPAAKRREYRTGLPVFLAILLPLGLGFPAWASAAGAPGDVGNASVLLFIGTLVLYSGLIEPGRKSALFVAIPSIVVALLWPFVSPTTLWMALFAAIGGGMIASGLAMQWQLKTLAAG